MGNSCPLCGFNTVEITIASLRETFDKQVAEMADEINAGRNLRHAMGEELDQVRREMRAVVLIAEDSDRYAAHLLEEKTCAEEQLDIVTERNKQLLQEVEALRAGIIERIIALSAPDVVKAMVERSALQATIRDLTAKVETLEARKAVVCPDCRGRKYVMPSGTGQNPTGGVPCDCGTGARIVGDNLSETPNSSAATGGGEG